MEELKWTKFLALFEGIFFFMAGICAMMSGSILGYISGGALVILGCASIFPVFTGGDAYWINMGIGLAENESLEEYTERTEEEKQNENADI